MTNWGEGGLFGEYCIKDGGPLNQVNREQIPNFKYFSILGTQMFLQISLLKKQIILKQPKLSYESHLTSHTSETVKKLVRILETGTQSSKNAQNWLKILKIHDVDKSTLVFSLKYLFVFPPEAQHTKHKKKLDKTVFKKVVLEF